MIRRLRHQASDSIVVELPDGLQMAIPSWMLDPLACGQFRDSPRPCLSIDALLALCDLLHHHTLLVAGASSTSGVSQTKGVRDAPESSVSPRTTDPSSDAQPSYAASAHPPPSAVSRTAHRAPHPRDAQRTQRGDES
jgi:hypothetical protein